VARKLLEVKRTEESKGINFEANFTAKVIFISEHTIIERAEREKKRQFSMVIIFLLMVTTSSRSGSGNSNSTVIVVGTFWTPP